MTLKKTLTSFCVCQTNPKSVTIAKSISKIILFFSSKDIVLQFLKRYWYEKRRPSPRISNNPFLKHRRQSYIRNPILFLNYCNHFYIFFLFRTFAWGTIFLLLIISRTLPPLYWPLIDTHGIRATAIARKARQGRIYQVPQF